MIRQVLAARLDLTTIGGEKIVGRRWRRGESHPWEVLSRAWVKADFGGTMTKGAWCVVLRPGFVNGIDPLARASVGYDRSAFPGLAVASDRAARGLAQGEAVVVVDEEVKLTADKREDRPLLQGPMIALNFAAGKEWPGARATPLAIQNRGVPAKLDAPKVSVNMDTVQVDTTREVAPAVRAGQRIARTVDVVLAVARLGLQESVKIGAEFPVTGRLVEYSTSYSSLAVDHFGLRPFLYQAPDYDLVEQADARAKAPSAYDRFFGSVQTDDELDKQRAALRGSGGRGGGGGGMKTRDLEDVLSDLLIVQLGIGADQITPEARLTCDLGADSLDMVEILMAIEEVLGIIIPDEDMDSVGAAWRGADFTFEQLVALVTKHQEAA